jgi:hypothetical protein
VRFVLRGSTLPPFSAALDALGVQD